MIKPQLEKMQKANIVWKAKGEEIYVREFQNSMEGPCVNENCKKILIEWERLGSFFN